MNDLRKYTEDLLTALFSYAKRERRGIILICTLLVIFLSVVFITRDRPLNSVRLEYIGHMADSARNSMKTSAIPSRDSELFKFDPNMVTVEELMRLGFSERQATAIDNYRRAGAVFRKPEDFARSFVVSQDMFQRLNPYISIAPVKPVAALSKDKTLPVSENKPKEKVYIELNAADSAALCTVYGVGPVLSRRIIEYRQRLGGFVSREQLREVYGINEDNFHVISEQFFVDNAEIQKIDINFAPSKELASHPYITRSMANRIAAGRKIKGGWSNLRELTDDDILLPDEAERISAYVVFR